MKRKRIQPREGHCNECGLPFVIVNGWAVCPSGHGKLRFATDAPEGAPEYKSCRNLNKFSEGLKALDRMESEA